MFRKKPEKPKLQGQALLDALIEAEQAHDRARKEGTLKPRKKKKQGSGWLEDWPSRLKTTAIVLGVILVGLIADGIRRENGELHATVTAVRGKVTVKTSDGTSGAGTVGMSLGDRDTVSTGANSSATLTFPDGSVIDLEPGTRFEVRTLDYTRGGRRDRSFMVRAGTVFARFSRLFGAGAGSEGTVCTPTAVAAVRGTGFRVSFDPGTKQTTVQVAEGRVGFRTGAGEVQSGAGQVGQATGYDLLRPQPMDPAVVRRILTRVRQADRYVKLPGMLQNVEYAINTFLDPVLQVLGLAPGTWSYGSVSAARVSACRVALIHLREDLESHENPPQYPNPITLEELNSDPQRRDLILSEFQNKMLLSYQLQNGKYVIRVRARDRGRTLFELTNSSLQQIKE